MVERGCWHRLGCQALFDGLQALLSLRAKRRHALTPDLSNPSNHGRVPTTDGAIMSQSLTNNGCSIPGIPYPPLPHPKAVQAVLTPEGINRGEAEEPFPEPSPGAPCPGLLTTPRALGLVHRCVSCAEERDATSHHPRTCTHLSRRPVERCWSEPGLDRRGPHVGLSQPVFYQRSISTRLQHVCRHRLLQAEEPRSWSRYDPSGHPCD
jgi:hypothetical protein